jgi:hypothetical protein
MTAIATPANQQAYGPNQKFQRIYFMQVQGKTQTWNISYPITMEMDITRGAFQSTAEGEFILYNLSDDKKSDIYLDWNDQLSSSEGYRKIVVRAGYQSWNLNTVGPLNPNSLPIIFSGQLYSAYSTRSGPSWITTIRAWDGGFSKANSFVSVSFDSSVPFNDRVTQIAKSMQDITSVYISPSITAPVVRGRAYKGSAWDILLGLADSANADLFIDLGKLYMVPKGQPVPGLTGGLDVITSDFGLLNTPIKQKFFVSFDMLFEPRLTIMQSIILQSLESVNNGSYTLVGIKHRGIISGSVGGDLVTTPTCFYGAGNLL